MKSPWFLVIAVLALSLQHAAARGQAEFVVVVVWDGMRPDYVTPQFTPTLYELALRGTFFMNHHSAYISSTEVNGTVLATGMQPDHNGIIANIAYRPDFGWLTTYATESLDIIRRGDLLSHGHYLETATVAEILQGAGFPTAIAGAKPVALLHDRARNKSTEAQRDSVTLFRGQTLPRSALEALVKAKDIGPLPVGLAAADPNGAKSSRSKAISSSTNAVANASDMPPPPDGADAENPLDAWTTKALVHGLWRKAVPKYSLLWLSEPDATQHESGVGSAAAIAAIESCDKNLAAVMKALEEKGVLESTDLFVVSDHGFSTINRSPDILESLKRAKFTAGHQFQNPEPGDIMVISLGGSTSFYVFDHDQEVIRRLVAYLQGTDFAGVIFTGLPMEGTFPLAKVHLSATNTAPDVVVAMRWSAENNECGAPGMLTSIEGKKGHGTHASLSRYDLHNTLVAAGPDFKKGFVSQTPSGNIDLAPTILWILGVGPPRPMDGRVLFEAVTGDSQPQPEPIQQTVEASHDLGFLVWKQYLKFTRMGATVYYDEGNGECRLK